MGIRFIAGPPRKQPAIAAALLAVGLITSSRASAAEVGIFDHAQGMAVRVTHSIAAGGWAIVPITVVLLGLLLVSLMRWLAYGRWRIFPGTLRDELMLVAHGMAPDQERLSRLSKHRKSPLARVVQAALSTAGRPLGDSHVVIDDEITLEMAVLKRPNRWFNALYGTSCLIGLLGAIIALMDALSRGGNGDLLAASNHTLATALGLVGLGIATSIAARFLGEWFQCKQEATAVEMARRVRPLALQLSATYGPRYRGEADNDVHVDEMDVEVLDDYPDIDEPRRTPSSYRRRNGRNGTSGTVAAHPH